MPECASRAPSRSVTTVASWISSSADASTERTVRSGRVNKEAEAPTSASGPPVSLTRSALPPAALAHANSICSWNGRTTDSGRDRSVAPSTSRLPDVTTVSLASIWLPSTNRAPVTRPRSQKNLTGTANPLSTAAEPSTIASVNWAESGDQKPIGAVDESLGAVNRIAGCRRPGAPPR